MTLVGLEPTISGSVDRCLIHWATGPRCIHENVDAINFQLKIVKCHVCKNQAAWKNLTAARFELARFPTRALI